MLSLYEISEKFRSFFENPPIDEETGEITDYAALDAIDASFDEKAESVACFIKSLQYEASALKNEETSLELRRKRIERKQESMTKYLISCMDAVQKEKVSTPRCAISFRKSKAVNIFDENKLPDEFIKVVEKRSPDKAEIKKAILSGIAVPGAEVVENRNLQIK